MQTIINLSFLLPILVGIAIVILIRCYLAYQQLKSIDNEIYKSLQFYMDLHSNMMKSKHHKYYLKEFKNLYEKDN